MSFNEQDVRLTYRFLAHEKETEIRLIHPNEKQSTKSIFVHTEEEFVKTCKENNGKYNIYAGINERKENGTKEQDVQSIKTLILDIDPIRTEGYEKEAATEEELEQAKKLAETIITDSTAYGIRPPAKNMSGNGIQLWYAIPIIKLTEENKNEISEQLKLFQKKMQQKFNWMPEYSDPNSNLYNPTYPKAGLDNIGDLPRIIKVIGTLSIKGKNTPERPHRLSQSITAFARNEDATLKETILDQTLEPEKENEIYDMTITDTNLPPCIDYILNKHTNTNGKGWKRMISFLTAFYRQTGKPIQETTQIIKAWNQKQPHHEPEEEKELIREITQVYKKELQSPLCKTLKKTGGYPEAALADMNICHPDEICKNERTKGPLGYVYWKKQTGTIEIQNLENINEEQYGGKKLRIKGSIFRLKKQTRITQVTYRCPSCGVIIKVPQPQEKFKCSCGSGTFKLINMEKTSGYAINLINDFSNLASSETFKVFTPATALGIRINPTITEQEEIGRVLKKIGKTVEAEGEYKTKTRYDKNTQEYLSIGELQATKMHFVDFLKDFNLDSQQYENLKQFCKSKEWQEQLDQIMLPEIIGRELTKEAVLLTALTVQTIRQDGKTKRWGIGRGAIFGDPGEAKSEICQRFLDAYCEGLNVLRITAETLSMAGLKGGVIKEGDEYFIEWGVLPWCHGGMLIMDGYHAYQKEDIASLRETETSNKIDIYKIAKGSRDCAFRGVKISNIRLQPIRENYDTKYDSSFDIGYGPQDQENKFDDADRRRVDWIIVYSQDDIEPEMVDKSLLNSISQKNKTLIKYQENIRKLIMFAWTRKSDDIDHDAIEKLTPSILKILKDWRDKYLNIKLSILGKEGSMIFTKYLLASAIKNFNMTPQGKIIPTPEDVTNTKQFFEKIFKDLEVDKRISLKNLDDTLAREIYTRLNEEQKDILYKLSRAGTINGLNDKNIVPKTTLYRTLKIPVIIKIYDTTIANYSILDGYNTNIIKIDPLVNNGRLTNLGKKVIQLHRQTLKTTTPKEDENDTTISTGEESVIGTGSSNKETRLNDSTSLLNDKQEKNGTVGTIGTRGKDISDNMSHIEKYSQPTTLPVPKVPKVPNTLYPQYNEYNSLNDVALPSFDEIKKKIMTKMQNSGAIEEIKLIQEFENELKSLALPVDLYDVLESLAREGEIFQLRPGTWKVV